MHVGIVGAGIMGLSTAWALARAGHRVAVFDGAAIPNPVGSSVDEHRLIRYPYGDDDGYCLMVAEAYRAWEAMWADLGRRFYVETGTLALSSGADTWVERTVGSLDRCGIAWDRMDRPLLEQDFPFLDFTGIDWGAWLPTGGELLGGRIVAALAHWLTANGQRVEAGRPVTALDPSAATLRVGAETLSFDRVVVAAGPWTNTLLPHLAPRMTPSRQVVVYLAPPAHHAAAWAAAPMLLDIGRDAGLYAVPPRTWHGQALGLKVGDHNFAVGSDPDGPRMATSAEIDRVMDLAGRRLRDRAGYQVAQAKVCFYDMEAAERFIVEPLGPRAWVMTGFSGHGFKFGAVLGQRLAAAVVGAAEAASVTDWAAGR